MTREDLFYAIEEEAPYHKLINVLRAVVELHESFDFTWGGESLTSCKCGEMYPCQTIQTIEKELVTKT